MIVGKALGPYLVEKELGSGAMGTVFRARHTTTKEKVAIKLISNSVASNENALARFTREITILKQLSHPNITRYRGSGKFHGSPFYIMEYVKGESLDHVMARRDKMTWEEVVELGIQLCGALQHAHDKGIVHRDLKPSNIMTLADGTIKLTDFGIAKDIDVTSLTGANSTVGTAAYMSPEQCRGSREITPASDLYSLGVMFYELITGQKPFKAETVMDMFLKHTKGEFIRPSRLILDMPVWLDNLICQLLEKKPEQRPASAEIVAQSLQTVREKATAQLSAGVDKARKRRVDRSKKDQPLDETEKEIARTLLGKKSKKAKKIPIYQKGWFTISAVALVGMIFLGFIYYVFFTAPSVNSLLPQVYAARDSKDLHTQRIARKDGAIAEFLRYYPNHPAAPEIQRLADEIDVKDMELYILNTRNKEITKDGEERIAEQFARDAIKSEELGNIEDAVGLWQKLSVFSKKKSSEEHLHSLGLFGHKRLDDLKRVEKDFNDFKNKIVVEKADKKEAGRDPLEEDAIVAIRAEVKPDLELAERAWKKMKELRNPDLPEQRHYFIMACWRVHVVTTLIEKQKGDKK